MLKRILGPTNRKVRLYVGLLLVGLFCIQCTQTEAFRTSEFVQAIDGRLVGKTSSDVLNTVERLARTDHVALLEYCVDHYQASYRDYTCQFIKQERISGTLGKEQCMAVKFMERPFSVALAWTPETAPMGDRVLYVEGANGNQMRVRPTNGILRALAGGSVLRQPDGAEAMRSTLRPVNQFGFRRSLENLLSVYRQARQRGDSKESFGGYADVAGRKAVALVRLLPPKDDYPACKTVVFIDVETLLPICLEGYDWDGRLSCFYLYRDVKLNVGLAEADFLPEANGITVPAK